MLAQIYEDQHEYSLQGLPPIECCVLMERESFASSTQPRIQTSGPIFKKVNTRQQKQTKIKPHSQSDMMIFVI